MGRRTQVQLVLLLIGLVIWGYGVRIDEPRLQWAGIGCFAIGFVLRLAKRRERGSG